MKRGAHIGRSPWLAVLAAALGACAGPEGAEVEGLSRDVILLTYNNPFYASVSAFIGEGASGNEQVLLFRNKNDGTCQSSVIGTGSGLHNGIIVNLGDGDDYLQVIGATTPAATILCRTAPNGVGYNITLHSLVQDGQPILIYGGRGNDKLYAGDSQGVVSLNGEAGSDLLINFNILGQLSGGPGDDVLRSYAQDSPWSHVYLQGNEGADCLAYTSQTKPSIYDCGPDNDWSTGVRGDGCENLTIGCFSLLDNLPRL